MLKHRSKAALPVATPDQEDEAYLQAAEFIDRLPFKGCPLHPEQRRAWPRSSVFDKNGKPILGVPEEIQEATSMIAGYLVAQVSLDAESLSPVFNATGPFIKDDDLRWCPTTRH